MKYYAIQQAEREATIAIYGDLVPYKWDQSDVTAYDLSQEIKDLDVDVINVRINSCGGSVSEGWAIYNSLKAHPAKIVTYADGFVASAAIYPFLAGEERVANSVSAFYLHQVLTSVYGNADTLRKAADEVEALNKIGLAAFGDLGIDEDKLLELQKQETWLTPAEALELGIATEVRTRETPDNSAVQQILQVLTAKPQQEPGQKADDIHHDQTIGKTQEPAGPAEPKNKLYEFFTNLRKE